MSRKIQISTYLPEDIIDKIDEYKVSHKLKNRSLAIERMIIEWEFMKNNGSLGQQQNKPEKETKTREELEKELMDASFDEMFGDM